MIDLSAVRVRAKFFFEGERKFFIKGVTYGPFAPDDAGDHFGSHEGAVRDLDMMLEAGVNLVRIYYVPPCWFLDLCAERGHQGVDLDSVGRALGFPEQQENPQGGSGCCA